MKNKTIIKIMKKILIFIIALMSFNSIAQTKIYNQPVKYRITPNLSVVDSILTKSSADLLTATSVDDFKTQIGLGNYVLKTGDVMTGSLTINETPDIDYMLLVGGDIKTSGSVHSENNFIGIELKTGNIVNDQSESGAVSFLENRNTTFGQSGAFGYRIHYDGSSNMLSLKRGSGTTTATILEDDRINQTTTLFNKTRLNGFITGQDASGAQLQVNGFQRTGTIYLHEGGASPSSNNLPLENVSSNLKWDSNTIHHVGNYQIQAGSNITIDNTNPLQPEISATGGLPVGFYEEGTFTPTLIAQGGGVTYSITVAYATYTRAGNNVSFNIKLTGINTTGTPVGSLRLDGLPEIAINNTMSASVGFSGGDVNFYSIRGIISSASIYFNYQDSLDSSNLQTIQACTITGGILDISGTYQTNVYTP